MTAAQRLPAALLAAGSFAAAQVQVAVLLPEPLAATLAGELRAAVGPAAVITAGGPADAARAGGTVLVAADEWQLWQLARGDRLAAVPGLGADLPAGCRDGGARQAFPWSLGYAVAYDPGSLSGATPPASWEEVALLPQWRDRLGLVPPDVDPTPWLAAMEDSLRRGGSEASGYALWTTLDARVAGYSPSYPALLAELAAGRLAAAVLPEPLALAPGARSVLLADLGAGRPVARLGIAVVAPATEAAVALARRIGSAPLREQLAARAGLGGPVPRAGSFDGDAVAAWLGHFERDLRGRGHGVERLADALDIVFTLLFVVFVLLVWRRLRAADRRGQA